MHHVRQLTIGFLLLATIFGGVWMFRSSSDTTYSIDKPSPIAKQNGSDSEDADQSGTPGDASPPASEPVLASPTPTPSATPSKAVPLPTPTKSKAPIVAKKVPVAKPTRKKTPVPPAAGKPATGDAATEARVVTLVNAERAKAGCGAVHSNSKLAAAAQGHSDDMAARNYFAHDTPDGVDPWERARAAGYTTPTGENIAMGQRTAESVMESWMNSPGHRSNILNCGSHAIGMGLGRNGDGTPYWTQMFGSV